MLSYMLAAEVAETYPDKHVTLVQSAAVLVPGYGERFSRRILEILRDLHVEVHPVYLYIRFAYAYIRLHLVCRHSKCVVNLRPPAITSLTSTASKQLSMRESMTTLGILCNTCKYTRSVACV